MCEAALRTQDMLEAWGLRDIVIPGWPGVDNKGKLRHV